MLKPRFFSPLTLALASLLIPHRTSAADNWIEVRSARKRVCRGDHRDLFLL